MSAVDDDIIFVAMENWDEMWRRNQPIAAEFARRVPTRKLLYVGLSIDISHGIRRLSLKPLLRALFRSRKLPTADGYPNITLFNPVKWLPNTLTFGQRFNRWRERCQLRRAIKAAGLNSPILWLNPHYGLHLLGQLSETFVVYDIGDDWSAIKQAEWLRRQTIAEDAELCRRADALIVVSEHLRQLKEGLNARVRRIPNGVYVDRYTSIAHGTIPSHPATRDWPRPILAYTGTIHAERVDLSLIEDIARAFPHGTVALIGPNLLDNKDTERLRRHPNIQITGTFHFNEMPSVMSAFDVCIVPHAVSPFTESLSPLKLYEYLASGLPSVATPVPGFRDYPKLVYLADNSEAFISAIHDALVEPKHLRALRQAEAQHHSWDARMDAIESTIIAGRQHRHLCQRTRSYQSSSSATTLAPSH